MSSRLRFGFWNCALAPSKNGVPSAARLADHLSRVDWLCSRNDLDVLAVAEVHDAIRDEGVASLKAMGYGVHWFTGGVGGSKARWDIMVAHRSETVSAEEVVCVEKCRVQGENMRVAVKMRLRAAASALPVTFFASHWPMASGFTEFPAGSDRRVRLAQELARQMQDAARTSHVVAMGVDGHQETRIPEGLVDAA